MSYPRSMTGFGRGSHEQNGQTWIVEVKSVNHRFLDIKVKLPREFLSLEERIKKEVTVFFSRGHVDVVITISGQDATAGSLTVNTSLARQYAHTLLDLRRELGIGTENDSLIPLVAAFPDVISQRSAQTDEQQSWQRLAPALAMALEQSRVMREDEGRNLAADLTARLGSFAATLTQVEEKIPELIRLRQQNLHDKISALLADIDLDPQRLAQEVAIMTDKADVTEEVVRLKSHISQFSHFLQSDEPTGRKLDFLLQEFLREVNTLASKIANASVAHQSVEMKNEIEKIREQVQNLE